MWRGRGRGGGERVSKRNKIRSSRKEVGLRRLVPVPTKPNKGPSRTPPRRKRGISEERKLRISWKK